MDKCSHCLLLPFCSSCTLSWLSKHFRTLLRLLKARIRHPTPPPSYSPSPCAKNSVGLAPASSALSQDQEWATHTGVVLSLLCKLKPSEFCASRVAGECCPPCPGAGESGTHWKGESVKRTQDVPTPPNTVACVCGKSTDQEHKGHFVWYWASPWALSQALSSLFKGWPSILESSERK